MAALQRPTRATYAVHEEVTVDTSDHEDHTFCGIMFPVKCKELLPLDHVVISSVAVRGRLGPLTVWVSNLDDGVHRDQSFQLHPRHWTKIYERTHGPSQHRYCRLQLDTPVRLSPGQVRAIYIHSTLSGDEAIVYDNRHSPRTYDDALLSILTGRAHVSCDRPFGAMPIWGWGNPWRDNREFVGRLEYGAVYKLWNPNLHLSFGGKFQTLTQTLFLCQRRWESPVSMLPDDVIFYILNMCRWDWANDTSEDMKELRRRRRRQASRTMAAALEETTTTTMATANVENNVGEHGDAEMPDREEEGAHQETSMSCCHRSRVVGNESVESEDDDDDEVEEHREDQAEDEEDSEYEESSDDDHLFYVLADDDEDLDDEEEEVDEVDELDVEDEVDYEDEDDQDGGWEEEFRFRNDVFTYQDVDSDNDDDQNDRNSAAARGGTGVWSFQFARIHVMQALASAED